MITSENYITIPGFARAEYDLKGSELMIYSIIYGFSQTEDQLFTGTLKYISEWTGLTKANVLKNLNALTEKGLIAKKESFTNKTKNVFYKITRNDNAVIEETPQAEKAKEQKSTADSAEDFEKAYAATGRKGSKKNAFKRWCAMSDEDKEKAIKHIPFYYKSNHRQYLKDFEGYLNGRYYDSVVYDRNGSVLYDPDRQSSQSYCPTTTAFLSWNNHYGCYIYIGLDESMFSDGYNDDDRPDKARVMFHNGRGFRVWDAATKKWNKE